MSDKLQEILSLSEALIRIPSVSVGAQDRLDEVRRAYQAVCQFLSAAGLALQRFESAKYPAVLAGFPGQLYAPVMLCGHFDVVAPEPGLSQFAPYIEGEYLWGRGAGDMKTVVATYLIWMKETLQDGPPFPPINLLLVGNEETGELEPMGTGHVLDFLRQDQGYAPDFLIAGERTEESGTGLWGQVCVQNRGVGRFEIHLKGVRAHSGLTSPDNDLTRRVIEARIKLSELAQKYLSLDAASGWYSQIRFPFVHIGTRGVYNITPDRGVLGVELRGIPQDDVQGMLLEFRAYCQQEGLYIEDLQLESGIACDLQNPRLQQLLRAIRDVSGQEPVLGRKLAGTSARFAPGGNGVVWGQSGIGPHAADERHFIPSIMPYYAALSRYGRHLLDGNGREVSG